MKNILSREEFLNQQMNEGFVDSVKRGFNKIKNFFKLCFGKIQNMIVVFGSNGKLFPVVSPAAIIDHTAGSKDIQVYASPEMHNFVKSIGGKTDGLTTPTPRKVEDYKYGPDGIEYAHWIADKKYEDTVEYKNYMTLLKTLESINESAKSEYAESDKVYEDFKTAAANRVNYGATKSLEDLNLVPFDKLQRYLEYQLKTGEGRYKNRASSANNNNKLNAPFLIFGASGIGKSSIFNTIVDVYNKDKDASKKISLIRVGCDTLTADQWFMPVMPKDTKIQTYIENHPKIFKSFTGGKETLTAVEMKKLKDIFSKEEMGSVSFKCPVWFPAWEDSGNSATFDSMDEIANGAVQWNKKDNETEDDRPMDGGFIIFDEFLRVPDPEMFQSFMNLLTDRAMQGWHLGSRWVMVFCANRPDDDGTSFERFKTLSEQGPLKSRFNIIQVEPNPQDWKKWALSKGCDPAILHFIFEDVSDNPTDNETKPERINKIAYTTAGENSVNKEEYARWHTMINGMDKGAISQINPRKWEEVFNAVNRWKLDQAGIDRDDFDDLDDETRKKAYSDYSIYQMSKEDFEKVVQLKFDSGFAKLFWDWIVEQKTAVKLKDIMDNPEKTELPSNVKDLTGMKNCLNNLLIQFGDNFKEHPELCTDEKLSNLFLWLGKKFAGRAISVRDNFVQYLEDYGLPKATEHSLVSHQKACYMLYAAFPPEPEPDTDWHTETVEDNIKLDFVDNNFHDKDAVKKVQDLAKKYFSWNWDEENECLLDWRGKTKMTFGLDKDGNDII